MLCLRKAIVFLSILILPCQFCFGTNDSLEKKTEKMILKNKIDQIKKTIVFIGTTKKKEDFLPSATGFLISVDSFFFLVTAKHVVDNLNKKNMDIVCAFNSKTGNISLREISEIKQKLNADWIFHENKEVDICMIPFIVDLDKDDIKSIPEKYFLPNDQVYELNDIFFLSYQPGIKCLEKITPIIRSGSISKINENKTILIDAFAFPGNSGSPVFKKPSGWYFNKKGGISFGDKYGGQFLGVIGSYVSYKETAFSSQTGRPRIIFEENTGLSIVRPVSFIKEIIDSVNFKNQLDYLKKLKQLPTAS